MGIGFETDNKFCISNFFLYLCVLFYLRNYIYIYNMKRAFAFLLSTLCVMSMLAYDFQSGNLYYDITSNVAPYTVEVTSGNTKYSGDITIPSSVTYNGITYAVTGIGYQAFYNCSSLTSVTIPNSVTSIGSSVFYDCTSLTSISIPNSVTSIENHAFRNCTSLTSLTIGNSVKSIGNDAFAGCSSLTSLTIPNSVTSIENDAFWGCSSLTFVTIPNTVTSIGAGAFGGTGIYFDESNWENDILYFNNCLLQIRNKISGSHTIKSNTRLIAACAFEECSSLTSITIPNSVTSIGREAFWLCTSLTSITIPSSIKSIEEYAFLYCTSLNTIRVEATTPPALGNDVFTDSPVSTCYIPCGTLDAYEASDWAQYVSEFVEEGCIDPTWQITYTSADGNIVTPYKTDVFGAKIISNEYKDGVGTITFDGHVTTIGDDAFEGCSSLSSITVPNSVTSIGTSAFSYCSSLTSITIPNSITSIGDNAFSNCSSLNSITIPNSVTSIESNTFQGCSSLTSVTFFNSVRHIQWEAFKDCINLDDIIIPEHITVICSDAFDNTGISNNASNWEDGVLYIDDCLIDAKESLNGAYTIKDGTRLIARCAFKNCSTLTSFTIPQSVDIIGQLAFEGTGYYNDNANWEDGVLYINDWLICANTSVPNEYIIKDATRMIAEGAFLAKNVVSITLPNSLEGIGTVAFGMTPITSLIIPENVSIIYEKAFGSNITSIELRATTPPTLIATVFTSSPICHIPCGTLDAYEASDWASQISKFVEDYPYTLTISSSNNSMGSATITQEPACNTPAIITATPNNGYHFVQWSDGNTDNPRTLTVAEDIELTAEFEEDDNQDNGSYSRNVRIGYNTICLPHGSSHFTGATFYEIAHILKNNKKIFFDEVKTLEAGKPYIFYPHSNEVTIYYDNTTSAIPLSHNGLHGTFDGITAASNFLKGKYLVAGDRMVLCGDGCSLAANRAYIELDEISDKDSPAIPGIKRVSMDYSEANETTALDNITDESIVAPIQEGVYDILGRKVDAPTVSGFYIINGKKVFIAL